jgi:hypothetical protein
LIGRRQVVLFLLGVIAGAPGVAAGQDPPRPPADSIAADSLAAAADDSSSTDRLLAVQGQQEIRLATMPRVRWGDLQPSGSRIVLTRDSIDWAPARTLGDLLAASAPVYLWRGGWLARPELPNLLGRGATSVHYVVDGLPWLALGPDSLAVDPSLWSLDLIDRVEIERLPGEIRISLHTRAHDRLAPRTRIGVTTGDRGFSRYSGSFERRWNSGIGLALAADYTGVNSPNDGPGAADNVNGWAQLSWAPSARLAVQAQLLLQAPDREPLLGEAADTLDPGLTGDRKESQLRVSWRRSPDGLGLHADLWAARSSWSGDSVEHDVGTFGMQAGLRRPSYSLEARALHHTEWTPLDTRLAIGWSPTTLLTLSGEAVYQEHEGDRTSQYATARIGVEYPRGTRLPLGISLPIGLRLGAVASHGERVDAPSLEARAAQSFTDYEASAAITLGRLLQGEARLLSTDAWQALPYRSFRRVASFARQDRTEWLALKARLAPTSWFSVASHYEHPLRGASPDGVPPHHSWTTATVNSRFLKNFPSGIFRLKVEGVVETWSPGIVGRDAEGAAIELPGLTFVRGLIQLQIGPFIAYWDRVNFQGTRQGHVAGYPILSLGSSYGIRWEFFN